MGRMSVLSLLVILLAACATSRETYTADGQLGHSINCSSSNWGRCYEKAGELCGGKGYEVLEKSGEKEVSLFGEVVHRSMIIRCKR